MKKHLFYLSIPLIALSMIGLLLFVYRDLFPMAKETRPRVIVILKTSERVVDFWKVLEHGILQGAEDYDTEVLITGPAKEDDISDQIFLLEQAIESKPDVIVLAAADQVRLIPPVKKAMEAGIPILTVDSFIHTEDALSQIGTANYEAGEKIGTFLKNQLPEGSIIGVLSYVRESSTAIDREQGFRDSVDGYFTALPTVYNNDKIEKARSDALDLMRSESPPDAIIALNETTARGVVGAIQSNGKPRDMMIVTFDSNHDIVQYIEDGTIRGTIVQKPYTMGYLSIKTAIEIIGGSKPPKRIDTGSALVTSDNLSSPLVQKLLFPIQ